MENTGAQEEVMGINECSHIVKGKRTKRQRLMLQQPTTAITSSSSGGGDDRKERGIPSPTTSAEFSESREEEEDMANCLILLAQGDCPPAHGFRPKLEEVAMERFSSRRFTEAAATASTGKAGFYMYECKTCNRCFPSFQALGGHRASHKRPKATEEKKALEEENQIVTSFPSPSKAIPYNKSRVHECSICGSEFSSGQALGGHMRRHRTAVAEAQDNNRKQRNVLTLDLNLPAPEEEREFPKSPGGFAFSGKQPLVFVTSTLVDCHY